MNLLSTRYAFPIFASPNQRFNPNCFDNTVGQVVPIKLNKTIIGYGKIVSVIVKPDGYSAEIIIEWTDVIGDQSKLMEFNLGAVIK